MSATTTNVPNGKDHDSVKDAANRLQDKAKAEAAALTDQARVMADQKTREFTAEAGARVDETAARIRSAGHEFGSDSYPAQAADYFAENLHYAADFVRTRDLETLGHDVTQFARRNPAMFLGGAALIGFGLARLMKASEDK